MWLLFIFNVFLVASVILQTIQIGILLYLLHRVIQDKNAAVAFCKSVFFQLQGEIMDKLFSSELHKND
jgi:hypothetical protein